MYAPDGYTLEKCLLDASHKQLYRGVRDSDGVAVVLKVYPMEADVEHQQGRAYREFTLLRSLPPGVGPQAFALEPGARAPVLVLEQIEGEHPRGPMSPHPFLKLAIEITRLLACVHAERLVHRGVSPQALVADSRSQALRLVDFGQTARLGAPAAAASGSASLGEVSGSLYYTSPEQTGRIERGIDFRSDLYSAGATFYELLTGRAPFDVRDPLELIRAHIALRPRTPTEVRSSVPATLTRIVMKLLEKEPEDRYQTAEALRVDLETCLEQLDRTGTIDDEIPLGTADAPYRPLFRRRVYGREEECACLTDACARARTGKLELVVVRGAPGIGKSALVPELYRPLAAEGGYLARGKLDLYRGHLPYAGLVSVVRSLVSQIVRESEERRSAWREHFCSSLGGLAEVMVEFVPEVAGIVGTMPAPPRLDAGATQKRLGLAVRRFMESAAKQAAPLVLFLDDVQWADAGSRYLIEELLRVPPTTPLLCVLAYRDNEVGEHHPLVSLLQRQVEAGVSSSEISLGPLQRDAVRELLADALGGAGHAVGELAEIIAGACASNPLLIQQCVYHLHERGCIQYGGGSGWTWDCEAAAREASAAEPVGMMLARLQRLAGSSRAVIQLASCVGDEFSLELLEGLSSAERSEVEAALYDLSDEGLVAPCEAGFRFVHDRIREAAQRLLPDSERHALHYRTARLLLDRVDTSQIRERCFEIADHLSRATACIPEDFRLSAAECHRDAALTALGSGAFATADHYLKAALALLRDGDWAERPALAFQLAFHLSICACHLGRFQDALDLLDRLQRMPLSTLQEGLVATHRVVIYADCRPRAEALDLLYATLERFGNRSPRFPSWIRTLFVILRTDFRLRHSPDTWPFQAVAPNVAPNVLIQAMLLSASARVRSSSVRLACFGTVEMVDLALRHGYLASPGAIIAAYGVTRRAFLRSSRGLERYARATELWLERAPDAARNATGQFYLWCSALAWLRSRRSLLEPLREIAESLAERGEMDWESSAWFMRANYAAFVGERIAEVLEHFRVVRPWDGLAPVQSPGALSQPYRWLAGTCSGSVEPESVPALIEPFSGSAELAATHWMTALAMQGALSVCWNVSELVSTAVFQLASSHTMDYLLFRGISATSMMQGAGVRKLKFAFVAARCERAVRAAAHYGPDFRHMADFIRAERLRASGRMRLAISRYTAVIDRADEIGYVHHAALACERMSLALAAVGEHQEATEQLSRARDRYRLWGAQAKVESLDTVLGSGA